MIDGYISFPIKELSAAQLAEVSELLTTENPAYANFKRYSRYGTPPPSIILYYIYSKRTIQLPRNINLDYINCYLGKLKKSLASPTISELNFNGKLLDFQEEVLAEIKTHKFDTPFQDFILTMNPGHGKTIIALYYISQVIKSKTIVVVPTLILADQWKKRVNEFLPKAKVAICSSPNDDLDVDIYIINVDRLVAYSDKFPDEFWTSFGCTIFDEVHRDGANTYLPMISKFNSKYRIGLTATFRRHDNREEILRYFFGKQFIVPAKFEKARILTLETDIKLAIEEYSKVGKYISILETTLIPNYGIKVVARYKRKEPYKKAKLHKQKGKAVITIDEKTIPYRFKDYQSIASYSDEIIFSKLDTKISENTYRNKLLISVINKMLDLDRKVLFVSKRKKILIWLYKYFLKRDIKAALLVGAKPTKDLIELEEAILKKYNCTKDEYIQYYAQIVFGIKQLVNEGFDAPELDTLILHTPMKDLEQVIGRIERYSVNKKFPLVILPYDDIGVYRGMYVTSLRYTGGCKLLPRINTKKFFTKDFLLTLR